MKLYLWPSIIVILSLPCVFSRCQGIGHLSLSIYPEGLIKVPYGEPVEIFCQDDNYIADELEFVLGGSQVTSEKVNTTARRLYLEQQQRGVYAFYCRNKVTNKVCPTRLLVDTAPQNVTDFACFSQNLDYLNCTWTQAILSSANYSLSFITYDNRVRNVCSDKQVRYGKTNVCLWTVHNSPRYRQLDKHYNFVLKACNIFGCNEQNFTINHFAVVKPDPPSFLKIIDKSSHSVLLQWNIPNNMVDLLPYGVDHKIEYQIFKSDNTSHFLTVNASELPARNKTYKFLLTDLPYAYNQYEVRIRIKTKEAVNDEFWSDFSNLVFYTAGERPIRPPSTEVGVFFQTRYEDKRRIYIHWKQLEEYEKAGANFTYKVVAHQEKVNPKSILADNKRTSYVVLEDASLQAINIQIWSINEIGSSINCSRLYIPAYTNTELLQVSYFAMFKGNGTYKLLWDRINNIDNYTLLWCEHNTYTICDGTINFTTLEFNKTKYILELPEDKNYQFAISANRGIQTSGMVWASIEVFKDGVTFYNSPKSFSHIFAKLFASD